MKKLKSEDKGLFRNVCTCQVGMGIAMTMIGAVLPQIAGEYELDYSFSGLMLSVQSAGYFIAGLAAGYLPRYFGCKKVLRRPRRDGVHRSVAVDGTPRSRSCCCSPCC